MSGILFQTLLICALLYFGRMLFVPLSFSVFISCLLYPICRWLEKKGIGSALSIAISLLIIILIFGAVVYLLIHQFTSFVKEWPMLQAKLVESFQTISRYLTEHYNISLAEQEVWLETFKSDSGSQIFPFLKTTIGSISVTIATIVIIPIFSALILYQRKQLVQALQHYARNISPATLKSILEETIVTYYNFIKGMLVVYLTVGLLNSIGLLIIGVPHAFLFGFIAAILTFIPYIGIMIGAILPMVVSWVSYDSWVYPAGVVLVFSIVQYLEANIIFPWAVSNKLNINTLATIIAIITGGLLWGSAGMILFVPFLGIIKILSERIPGWEGVSAMLDMKAKQ